MAKIKVIPDNFSSTSLPQQWHKPRRKTISSEPLMDMILKKKTKLDQATAQAERNVKSNYSMKLKNDLADRSLSSKMWWGIVNPLWLQGPATRKSQPLNILTLCTQQQKTKPTSSVKSLQKNAGQKMGIFNLKRLQCTLESRQSSFQTQRHHRDPTPSQA